MKRDQQLRFNRRRVDNLRTTLHCSLVLQSRAIRAHLSEHFLCKLDPPDVSLYQISHSPILLSFFLLVQILSLYFQLNRLFSANHPFGYISLLYRYYWHYIIREKKSLLWSSNKTSASLHPKLNLYIKLLHKPPLGFIELDTNTGFFRMKSSTVYVLMMIICVTFGVLGKQENTKTETKVDKVAQKITCGGGGELITTGVIKAWCMKMGPSGPKPVKFKCNKNKLAFCDKGYSLHHTKAEKYPCKSKGHTETKPDPKKYPLKCT